MKNKKRVVFGFFMGLILSANALVVSAQGNRSVGTIVTISNFEGHFGPLVKLSNMAATEGSCPRNDWFILEETHKFYDQNYSAILAAKMAEREIVIISDEGDCVQNLPRLKHLYIP